MARRGVWTAWGLVIVIGFQLAVGTVRAEEPLPLYTRWENFTTENGLPDHDDDRRPAFLVNHLKQVWHAINDNVPVMGYYHWTLTDNFEWAEGWNLRFGLVELDPDTQRRSLRRSGELYAEVCKANVLDTDMERRYAPQLMETVFKG